MVYTEIQDKKGRKYYYRVKSVKKNKKTLKEKIYLGVNLDKNQISDKELEADKELLYLNNILTNEEINEIQNNIYNQTAQQFGAILR